jgi:hypothetical protein
MRCPGARTEFSGNESSRFVDGDLEAEKFPPPDPDER